MQQDDWHRADIIAALKKRGYSLRRLSIDNELQPTTLAKALSLPYPKCERIIARALNVKPQEIWPSRYTEDGRTKPRNRSKVTTSIKKATVIDEKASSTSGDSNE